MYIHIFLYLCLKFTSWTSQQLLGTAQYPFSLKQGKHMHGAVAVYQPSNHFATVLINRQTLNRMFLLQRRTKKFGSAAASKQLTLLFVMARTEICKTINSK
jgi:hypothetical protein